jgi:hypothetical protein
MRPATRRAGPLGYKRFLRSVLLTMKDFRLDDRVSPYVEGGEPKIAIATWPLVHSLTSVLMIARGLREAAIGEGAKGPEEQ